MSLWAIFLSFDPPNNLKNQNFEKMKKHLIMLLSFYTGISQIMIILCMVPEIWSTTDIIFFSFCPFTLLTNQKIKILKKKLRNPGDIIISHRCTINDNHMIMIPEIAQQTFFLHFGEHDLEKLSFYTSVPKIMIIC